MAPRQLCHGLWHKALGGWPGLGEGPHVVQVAPRPTALVRELSSQVLCEPVDHPAAPAGLHLPLQDVPADRPVQLQQLTVGCPGRPHPRRPHPGLELLEQPRRSQPAPAEAHSRPLRQVSPGGGQPGGHGGGPGCTTPRPAWLSHPSRELICPAARTCSSAPSPTPDDALLRARLNAVVAACWLVWPLTTATGPCSGSVGSACTTNQRDRPRERTTPGAPAAGAGTLVANAGGASPAASVVAATGSAGRAGAGAAVAGRAPASWSCPAPGRSRCGSPPATRRSARRSAPARRTSCGPAGPAPHSTCAAGPPPARGPAPHSTRPPSGPG